VDDGQRGAPNLIGVGVAVQRGPPFPVPRARSNVSSECRRQGVMRCLMQASGRACSLCHTVPPCNRLRFAGANHPHLVNHQMPMSMSARPPAASQ
jgi:hypothetical protein